MSIRLVAEVPLSWSLKKKFFTLKWIYLLSERGDTWLTEKSMVESIGCSMNTFLSLRSDLIKLGWVDITEAPDSKRMCHYLALKSTQPTDPIDTFVSAVLSGKVEYDQINKLNASSKFVLIYFLTLVDCFGALPITASLAFAKELAVSEPTLFRIKKQLRDAGVLKTIRAANRNSLLSINYSHNFLELKQIADVDLKVGYTAAIYRFDNIGHFFKIFAFIRYKTTRDRSFRRVRLSSYKISKLPVQSEFLSLERLSKWPSTLLWINNEINECLRLKKIVIKADSKTAEDETVEDKTAEDDERRHAYISEYLAAFTWLVHCPPYTLNSYSRHYFIRCYIQVLKLIFVKEKFEFGNNETALLIICHIFGLGTPGVPAADVGALILKLSRAERPTNIDDLPKLDVQKLPRLIIVFATLLLALITDDLKTINTNLSEWHKVNPQLLVGFSRINDNYVFLYYLNSLQS